MEKTEIQKAILLRELREKRKKNLLWMNSNSEVWWAPLNE